MIRKSKGLFLLVLLVCWLLPSQSISQSIEDVTITVYFDTVPDDFSADIAKLKYNKRFALSMQVDDGNVDIYERGFPVFEGGTFGTTTYNGFSYTDGCGNNLSFKMSSAIYMFQEEEITGADMHINPASDIITWEELNTLFINGWGIQNHGLNNSISTDIDFMNYAISRNISYCRRMMYNTTDGGVITKAFVNPYNFSDYSQPAFNIGEICALNQNSSGSPFDDNGGDVNDISWRYDDPYNLFRQIAEYIDIKDLANRLDSLSVDGANYWAPILTHDLRGQYGIEFSDFVSSFNYISSTYGKDSLDNILMTTDEEILDYLFLRDGTDVNTILSDSVLTISFSGNHPTDLLFYDLTLVLNSNVKIDSILVDEVTYFAKTGEGDTTGLINFSWDGRVIPDPLTLAQQKVDAAVFSESEYDALIAMDYVYTLDYGAIKDGLVEDLCNIPGSIPYDEGFCESGYPDFVEITGDSVVALGYEAVLIATADLLQYEWSTGETTRSIKVSPEVTTEYSIQATTNYDVVVSDNFTVTVINSYIIDNSPTYIHHTPGNPVELWVELLDEASPLWDNDSTTLSITVDPIETTIHTCYILVEGDTVQSLDFEIFVGNIPDFKYDTVCFGDTTTFINTTETSDTIVNVLWDLNGDAVFDDGTGDTIKYLYGSSGNHLTGMRVYFKNDPMDVVYIPVPVGYKPQADFSYKNNCLGYNTEFTDESTVPEGLIDNWFWTFGNGETDNFQNTTVSYDTAGIYEVTLVAGSELGCKDTISKSVEVIEIENIEVVNSEGTGVYDDDTVYFNQGSTDTLTIVNYDKYDSTLWYNNDKAQAIIIADSGEYRVDAYKAHCSTYIRFYAYWGSGPSPEPGNNIMNIFTPNGDGYNDSWLVNDPDMTYPIKVFVYNRSGNLVYENNTYDNTWQGTYNGNPLPQGAYYYLIKDSNGKEFKGSITIIR